MPRRGENIYKRKDGRWEGRFIKKYDIHGKAIYKSVYAKSYADVKEKIAVLKLQTDISKTSVISRNVDNYSEDWFGSVKIKCKASTYCTYRNIYRLHIKPFIGEKSPDTVYSEDIEKILASADNLSAKTKADILRVLKQIFSFISDNSNEKVIDLKYISVKQTDKQMRVFSVSEQRKLTDFLLNSPDLCTIGTYLCLCTGIRIGELCALRRKNINFESKTLNVRQTMLRVQDITGETKTKIIITEPKSKKSIRNIPIPDFLFSILRAYYENMENDAFILTGKTDQYKEPRSMQYKFKSYLKSAGVEDANFHTLRHTFATRCVETEFDIKTLSEILGHANVNITLSRYVHSSENLKRRSMEKLNTVMI